MAVRLYMDHNVRAPVTAGLRLRGVDVLTAYEDDHHRADDSPLLDRADALGRVLFTHDDDLIREAAARQRRGIAFTGVIWVHPEGLGIGATIADLELIAKTGEPEDVAGKVTYLPLR
ncbi:MAG: hypothetical protein D6696_07830 [Acidobacteria bacterium]|nr:MAG: hypothetical protein D6696_07830 [Acidobacteriota bacterium]